MKTSIDDATLQAARLTLARALLDRLPEPPPPVVDGKTSGQICFESSERARAKNMGVRQIKWETLADEAKAEWQAAASAVLAAFGGQSSLDAVDWKAKYEAAVKEVDLLKKTPLKQKCQQLERDVDHWCDMHTAANTRAEKAEAELAKAKEAIALLQDQESLSLSRLRPIAEAGPVPEGAVRVYGSYSEDKERWPLTTWEDPRDTHFADIYPPEGSQPDNGQVETTPDMIVPEPATFYAHGKTWTRHTPGDPMPCGEEAQVYILRKCDMQTMMPPHMFGYAGAFFWGKDLADNSNQIIGWRYADEPTPEPSIREVLDAIPVYLPTPPPWQPAVGDKVKLKGGSFTMTIEQSAFDGIACEWHDSNGVPQSRTYTPETLQPA